MHKVRQFGGKSGGKFYKQTKMKLLILLKQDLVSLKLQTNKTLQGRSNMLGKNQYSVLYRPYYDK